ncbi:MAG: hypothetical protein WAM85_01130 [Terracidiphilus sp.]
MVLNAAKLIQTVQAAGGRFTVDGDRLGVSPRTAAEPLLEKIREHKTEIIKLLRADAAQVVQTIPAPLSARSAPESDEVFPTVALPAGVRLVRWAPKAAPVRLSECSTVTDTEKFIGTTLAQLDAKLNGKSWQAGNWPLSVLIDRLAACGCVVKLTDPKRAVQ